MRNKNESTQPITQPALQGLRILDFSWVLAGPYATRILADSGAEIIKIQPRLPEAEDAFSRGYYDTWNRHKLGITLNPNKPQGREILLRLIAICDAVVENFSPRVMDNWGLDYTALQAIRPDIIYLRLSAAGHSGPRQNFSGFGPTVQAAAGLTSLTGYPSEAPLGIGFSISDHIAGLYAAAALLGALEYRQKSGRGQYIDLSQTETLASLLADPILEYTQKTSGGFCCPPAPQGIYRCGGENRWVTITVNSQEEWCCFKQALGQQPWMEQSAFSTPAARLQNKESLDSHIQAWSIERSPEAAMTALQEHGLAAGVVQNAADLTCDQQLKHRAYFLKMNQKAAPLPGQDNYYVYSDLLGLTAAEIDSLETAQVI